MTVAEAKKACRSPVIPTLSALKEIRSVLILDAGKKDRTAAKLAAIVSDLIKAAE